MEGNVIMGRRRSEIGAIGLHLFAGVLSDELNANLRGTKGIKVYNEMRRDEPAATSFLAATSNLLHTDLYVEPGGKTRTDTKAAKFVETTLTDMSGSVGAYVRQMYSCIWAGWDIHEIVWKRRSRGKYQDGLVAPSKLALRRQETFDRWGTDKNGEIISFVQRPAPRYDTREIPLTKCVHVVADDADGSPEGISALRGMYRQWYFVKNIELLLGISLERFGTGMPVFSRTPEIQASLTEEQLDELEEIAMRVRQNEYAYVIEPLGIKFRFEPSPGLNAATYLDSIMRMRTWMLATVLADFIALGAGGKGGAYALGKDKSELFLLALNGYQQRVLDALNQQLMPWLFKYNDFGKLTELPRFALPPVKRYDLSALGSFLNIVKNLGAFHPQPEDETMFRKIADVADVDPSTLKKLFATDQMQRPIQEHPANDQSEPMNEGMDDQDDAETDTEEEEMSMDMEQDDDDDDDVS